MQQIWDRVVWLGNALLLVIYLHEAKPQIVIRTQNEVVAAQVRAQNDTLPTGQILYQGLFNIGTADNRSLLYKFPESPYTSHFNVWLDGSVYSNDPFSTGALPLPALFPPSLLPDGTISCTHAIDKVKIEQRLQPEQFSDSTGAILIQYLFSNGDAVTHQIGLLLELDTNVNENDRTPFLTSVGYSDIEQEFVAAQVPGFFQAFEGDPVAPGLIAKGTLAEAAAVRPDLFIIGDWFNLRKVAWNYAPNGQKYNDSAVILRWNPQPLAPGQTLPIATYYGLGDVTIASGQLSLNVTAPSRLSAARGKLEPNPFDVNVIVTNTGFAPVNNVQVAISLPEDLELAAGELPIKPLSSSRLDPGASGTAVWRIQARCPQVDTTLKVTIAASASEASPNSTTRSIFVPSCNAASFRLIVEPKSRSITAGEQTTFLVKIDPSDNFSDPVHLSLWPPTPGVTSFFSPVVITPAATSQLQVLTETGLLAGNYEFVVIGEGGGITSRDTITLNVQPPILPDLAAVDLRTVGQLFAGQVGSVVGEIRNEFVDVTRAFRILFQVDGAALKDTSLTGLAAPASLSIVTPLRLATSGRHEITLAVDADAVITETNESNNQLKLIVEIQPGLPGKVRVRPNPFTPNGDGFNDYVEFDFTTVPLKQPSLHVFDSDGAPVITISRTGVEKILWDGRDKHGREVLPGIYFYTLLDQGHNVVSGYVVVAR